MKIKITRNCFVNGDLKLEGAVVEVEEKNGKYLVATGKATDQFKDASTGGGQSASKGGGQDDADKEKEKSK